ncbi:MAG: hypothetical protein U0U67_17420 [Chitinophagales bacterium]
MISEILDSVSPLYTTAKIVVPLIAVSFTAVVILWIINYFNKKKNE